MEHGTDYNTPDHSPLHCLGFLFDSQIAYISDVSYIPQTTWDLVGKYCQTSGEPQSGKPQLQVLVIDCLFVEPFPSHFGLGQAIMNSRRFGAKRTYLVGGALLSPHVVQLSPIALII